MNMRLGSSSYLTDNFGRPTHYYDQLPFGESMVEHNQSQYYGNQYKFNGKELDVATGMYYYGARYYDPRLSIFISVDPLAEQTFEPYSYTGNNPIMFTDPTGMSKEGGGDPLYKIYVRSFISASRAGNDPLGRHFRGDGRVASTRDSGPNLSGATSRASVTLGWYSPIQKSKLLAKDSDMTVRYPAYGIEGAQKKPTVNASSLTTINNQYPEHVPGTFGVSYSAKDPLTPKLGTPSLDVIVTGTITQGSGYIDISGKAMGDGFPSTEAFIEDSLGTRIFLGAHREQGDVSTLYGGA